MYPSTYGPRSPTLHVVDFPFDAVTVTTVPNGIVLWAHMVGSGAWYQVALPDSDWPVDWPAAGGVIGRICGGDFGCGLAVVVV